MGLSADDAGRGWRSGRRCDGGHVPGREELSDLCLLVVSEPDTLEVHLAACGCVCSHGRALTFKGSPPLKNKASVPLPPAAPGRGAAPGRRTDAAVAGRSDAGGANIRDCTTLVVPFRGRGMCVVNACVAYMPLDRSRPRPRCACTRQQEDGGKQNRSQR